MATVLDQDVFELLFRNGLVALIGGGRAILFGDFPVLLLQIWKQDWLYKDSFVVTEVTVYP